jgi:uncharacterized membrane protein YjfL (UPF0719 family)
MSPDEGFVTLAAVILAVGGWGFWVNRATSVARPASRPLLTRLFAALAVAALIILFVVRVWSDAVVQATPAYQFMYFVLGLAWVKGVEFLFAWGGISVRDDVVERGNAAAAEALSGALIGAALAYAGANIGDGPGWWVVVISAALSTASVAVVWTWLSRFTGVIDTITIDRDPAAGVRFGGFMAACGAIAGRAVAGDWHGIDGLLIDFAKIAPAMLPLLALAVWTDRSYRPRPDRPHPPVIVFGVVPGLTYIAAAGAILVWLGPPR